MDHRKFVYQETGIVALGQLICVAAMIGVFFLLDHFDRKVLLGGIVGGIGATLNFFIMAVVANLAADKAEAQNVKGGQAMIRASYFARTIVLFVIYFAFAKSGLCNAITLVLPLVFVRPTITLGEFFRKKGDA